jgi:sec-independent protein translocase protein TatA
MTAMTHALVVPLLAGLGPSELIIIALVIVLLFGASKLPELARGSGRALRIFKAETKGLLDDDDDDKTKTAEQREIDAHNRAAGNPTTAPRANPEDTSTPPPSV